MVIKPPEFVLQLRLVINFGLNIANSIIAIGFSLSLFSGNNMQGFCSIGKAVTCTNAVIVKVIIW